MDAVKIYQSGSFLVNFTNNSNSSGIDYRAIFDDYSMIETLDFWPQQVIFIVLYSTIAVVSFLVNLVTIAVLVKCDKICSELYFYLINLSVSDIVMSLFCIPFTYINFIKNRWIFPHWLCPFVNFAQITSVFVSVGTLTVIGLDRYAAIIHPLGGTNKCLSLKCRQLHEKRSRKLLSILAIWLVGIAAGSVQFLFTRVVSFPFGDRILFDCRESLPEHYAKLYTIFLFLSTFLVPLLILVYVYSIIGYQVWRHVAPGNPHHLRDHSNSLTRDKVIKLIIFIILNFFWMWAPLQIFNLLVEFWHSFLKVGSPGGYRFFVYGYLVSHLLAMSHCVTNPLVYCFLSNTFWQHFCSLTRQFFQRLANCCPKRHFQEQPEMAVPRTVNSLMNSTLSLFKKRQYSPPVERRLVADFMGDPPAQQSLPCTTHWKVTGEKPSNTIELNVINL